MNNQMPYGYMPQMNWMNELRMINERIDNLEKRVKKIEKKISMMETNNMPNNYPTQMPYNTQEYPNNYMI